MKFYMNHQSKRTHCHTLHSESYPNTLYIHHHILHISLLKHNNQLGSFKSILLLTNSNQKYKYYSFQLILNKFYMVLCMVYKFLKKNHKQMYRYNVDYKFRLAQRRAENSNDTNQLNKNHNFLGTHGIDYFIHNNPLHMFVDKFHLSDMCYWCIHGNHQSHRKHSQFDIASSYDKLDNNFLDNFEGIHHYEDNNLSHKLYMNFHHIQGIGQNIEYKCLLKMKVKMSGLSLIIQSSPRHIAHCKECKEKSNQGIMLRCILSSFLHKGYKFDHLPYTHQDTVFCTVH